MVTITATAVHHGHHVDAVATFETPQDGTTWRRNHHYERQALTMSPPQVAALLTPAMLDLGRKMGFGPLHGWRMPFASNDAMQYVFEFDFDETA